MHQNAREGEVGSNSFINGKAMMAMQDQIISSACERESRSTITTLRHFVTGHKWWIMLREGEASILYKKHAT